MFKRSATYLIVTGVLGIIFGLLAMFYPVSTVLALVVVWGIYALVDGILSLGMAFRPEGASARWFLIFSGIIGILAGIIAITRPFSSAIILTVTLAIWLLIRGILEIGSAFGGSTQESRWMLLLGGVLWILASMLMFMNPGRSALGIATWLGALVLIWGIVLVAAGFRARSKVRHLTA